MVLEILLIGEARIPSFRLLEQVLGQVALTTGDHVLSRTIDEVVPEDFTSRTLPLLVRTDTIPAWRLGRLLHGLGGRYWYYLDDNFWELAVDNEIGRYYSHPDVRQRVDEVVRDADRVLASTPALREYLERLGARATQVEAFFDLSLVPLLPDVRPTGSSIRCGFATSADRVADLLPVLPEIVAALDAHPRLEFELIAPTIAELPDHPRMRRFPVLPNYESYIGFQLERQWDFAIAPLSSSASNRYKSDNKYREYGALGIPGIYQESLPYASVEDGRTGLLVGESRRSWRDAIELYIADPALRAMIRRNAREDVERRRSIDAVRSAWTAELRNAPQLGRRTARRIRAAWRQPTTTPIGAILEGQRPVARRLAHGLTQQVRRLRRSP